MKKYKLGDKAFEVRELYEPKGDEYLHYIGLEHIEQQSLRISDTGSSSATVSTKKVFKSGDILFGTLRPYFRKVARPKYDGVCSTDITVIRAKQDTDQSFLFYFIANHPFIDHASNISSGTRMPRANWKVLEKSEWLFPSFKTQHKIASILSAYDDLIENNLKRIKILEEMAQAIYREWFVNFRFPGHKKVKKVKSKLGMIPEGWEVAKIGELLRKVERKLRVKKEDYLEQGEIPAIDQGAEFIGGYTNDYDALHDNPLPIIVFGDHTRIIKYVDFPFASGADGTQLLYPKNEELMPAYFYYAVRNIDLSNFAYARHFKFLKEQEVLIPNNPTLKLFNENVELFLKQMSIFRKSNDTLRKTRDLLLPKLISGEVDVSQIG